MRVIITVAAFAPVHIFESIRVCGSDMHFGPIAIGDTYMQQRHLSNWMVYSAFFNLPLRLDGLDVLDVGVMAGASSYLFAAMGAASVTAIEEAPTSCRMIDFIAESFRLPLSAECRSMYSIGEEELGDDGAPRWLNRFDLAVFSGVIYRESAWLVALRVC